MSVEFSNRTTSAGYRLPLRGPSAFHERCVPKQDQGTSPPPAAGGGGKRTEADYRHCNEVAEDKIWRESVKNEWKGVQQWEDNWGFLKEYDQKGRPKPQKELPDRVPVYSDNMPNTTNGVIGSRMRTDIGRHMFQLERALMTGHKKKKLGTELMCYD
ncbi:ciliary microtubule inner protein 5-like isoform X1 [Branchiostoma floridae x Branchiostoma belcheri]|nr:Phospholipase abhd3 [Branchiostoma belcheri]